MRIQLGPGVSPTGSGAPKRSSEAVFFFCVCVFLFCFCLILFFLFLCFFVLRTFFFLIKIGLTFKRPGGDMAGIIFYLFRGF